MDDLACATGRYPLGAWRRCSHPKHPAMLDAVAEQNGRPSTPPQGVHRSQAHMPGPGSCVAATAGVPVSDGQPKIHRIVAATDPMLRSV